MTATTAADLLIVHACTQAALCSALAPLFDNDPVEMAATGLFVGLVTGLPLFVVALLRRRRQ